ncbi:divalent-cation tolerance protein CutA [Sulfurospirillum sp. T05]|uniref:Divalent-cation tolerance protein CutA n=1 Tax=Sulfurospirillum tamanense TaxID=2813362 RepID=A0ABS2WQ44_9BACT|nr:divalent-cation tolerance protein CutA [Sulfurospirillum tamanensis]MBN2963745.1 divalent-cation tolerance protein CutA [Sulfurospirillum tamanensis]
MSALLVLSTVPNEETAKIIAHNLIGQNLAACISFQKGLTSVFMWEGKIQEENEVLLLIKTKQALFETLKTTLYALHPYDVPEIIAFDISHGHTPYLQWIDSVTKETV